MTLYTDKISAHQPRMAAFKITAVYFLVGIMWILFSDQLMQALVRDQNLILIVSVAKGWLFVKISSTLIYMLVRASFRKHMRFEGHITKLNTELEHTVEMRTGPLKTSGVCSLRDSNNLIVLTPNSIKGQDWGWRYAKNWSNS